MPPISLRAQHHARLLQLRNIHFPVGRLAHRDPKVPDQIFELSAPMFDFNFLRPEELPELFGLRVAAPND